MIKGVKNFDIKGKKVLLRCDFNVPLNDEGKIRDDFRIKQGLPTINYLVEGGAKIIIMTHLGSPKGKKVDNLKLDVIKDRLSEILNKPVNKISDCVGKKVKEEIEKMKEGEIILLENLRFYKEEEQNDPKFALKLAENGDIYINNAFSCSHRNHASIVEITKYLPSGAGILFQKEIKILSKVLNDPWRPFVAIIGGVKISTRTKLIKNLLEKADHVLFGGELANIILRVKGICVGKPWPEKDETVEEVEKIDITSPKVHLPVDVVVSPDMKGDTYVKEVAPGLVRKEELLLDVGSETINMFSEIIKDAKMIIWSGPMGLFEEAIFEKGTKRIGEIITRNHKAYKIVGGGDTLYAVSKFGLSEGFDHISTGGGALLSFLSKEELPGIKALELNGGN